MSGVSWTRSHSVFRSSGHTKLTNGHGNVKICHSKMNGHSEEKIGLACDKINGCEKSEVRKTNGHHHVNGHGVKTDRNGITRNGNAHTNELQDIKQRIDLGSPKIQKVAVKI